MGLKVWQICSKSGNVAGSVCFGKPKLTERRQARRTPKQKKPRQAMPDGAKIKTGSDLLSHTLVCSTIGEEELNF